MKCYCWECAKENEYTTKQAEESNLASIRVLKKCNFIPNGEMGEEGIRFVWKE